MREPLLPRLTGANQTPLNKPAVAPSNTNAAALTQTSPSTNAVLPKNATANASAWMTAQIRQHLPQSQPLTSTLERWVNQLNASTAPLDAKQQLVATFIDRLVTAKDLTQPQQLSAAIQNSGIWLEAQIAHTIANADQPAELAQDLKGQLLSLAEQLGLTESTSAPSEATNLTPEVDLAMAIIVETDAPAETDADTTTDESDETELTSEADDDERVDEDQDAEIKLENGAESSADSDSEAESNANEDAPLDANEMPDETEVAMEDIDVETPKSSHGLTTETATRSVVHSKRAHSDTLIHDIDGMIKHVVTQQLHSLNSDQPRWLLELPFRMPDGAVVTLNAEIERERRGTRLEDERWNMRLKLNLPHLGPLSINLSLRMERLDAGLQAGTQASATLIRNHLETLRQQLANQHLDIASLYAGYRPEVNTPSLPSAPKFPMIREQG